jgi:putative membrane protein
MSEEGPEGTPSREPNDAPSPAPADGRKKRKGGFWKIASHLADTLIFGPGATQDSPDQTDVSTGLAYKRTDLALERNYMAAERTLMAWIRTALSMISFGFTIGKLGQVLSDVEVRGFLGRVRNISVDSIAYFLVILGTLALLGATVQHWIQVREFRAMGLRRRISIPYFVAIALSLVGGFALSALILKL